MKNRTIPLQLPCLRFDLIFLSKYEIKFPSGGLRVLSIHIFSPHSLSDNVCWMKTTMWLKYRTHVLKAWSSSSSHVHNTCRSRAYTTTLNRMLMQLVVRHTHAGTKAGLSLSSQLSGGESAIGKAFGSFGLRALESSMLYVNQLGSWREYGCGVSRTMMGTINTWTIAQASISQSVNIWEIWFSRLRATVRIWVLHWKVNGIN